MGHTPKKDMATFSFELGADGKTTPVHQMLVPGGSGCDAGGKDAD